MPSTAAPVSATGISGLDHILRGGLPANRIYLVRGQPGTGKTTLALQYLLEGVKRGEPGLYITLSETRQEIEAVAQSHGWNLDDIAIFELSAIERQLKADEANTVFHPSEVELNQTTEVILAKIEATSPRRLALDSLSELRLLADSPLRYRRQLLSLKQYFSGKNMTVLLLDDQDGPNTDAQVQSLAHGVLTIELLATDYGAERRRFKVNKLRGVNFVAGYHDMEIVSGEVRIYPRLIASEHGKAFEEIPARSGNPGLDRLLEGGLDRGASCLILGPAGTGKSSIAMQFAVAAAERGEKVFYYLFEENLRVMLGRAKSLGVPMERLVKEGKIHAQQIDPAEMAPGKFVNLVQDDVQKRHARMIVIDSLNGYLQAMPNVAFLTTQLHELFAFLSHQGVVTLMSVAQHGVLGQMQAPIDVTYLADSVLLLRYFEQGGEIKKAISVVKKRMGRHETTIREFRFEKGGLVVGEPLKDFHGVLTGTPVFRGGADQMIPR